MQASFLQQKCEYNVIAMIIRRNIKLNSFSWTYIFTIDVVHGVTVQF